MAEQAKSVYYGGGNVGEAVVYQREAPNLFDMIDKKEARADKKVATEKAEFKDMMEFTPDEYFYPANEEINKMYNEYTKGVAEAYKSGRANDYDFQGNAQQQRNKINRMANKSTQWKDRMKEFTADTQAMKSLGLNVDKVEPYLLSGVKNADGSFKPIGEWDDSVFETYSKDPENWDMTVVGGRFVKDLEDEFESTKTIGGYDEKKHKKFYSYLKQDADGDPITDANGKGIIEVTPELLKRAKKTQGMDVLVEGMLLEGRKSDPNYTESEALESILRNYDEIKITKHDKKANVFAKINAKENARKKDDYEANNFFRQVNAMVQGKITSTQSASGYTIDADGVVTPGGSGRPMSKVVSPFDNKVVGKRTNDDNKVVDVLAQTLYDPESGQLYLVKNDGEPPKLISQETIGNIIEGMPDKRYSNRALGKDPWIDNKTGNFNLRDLGEETRVQIGKTREESLEQQKRVGVIEKNIADWNNNELEVSMNLIEKLGNTPMPSIGFTGDKEEIASLNNSLSKLPKDITINIGTRGAPEIIKSPKIEVTEDGNSIIINGSKKDYSQANLKAWLKTIESNIPQFVGEEQQGAKATKLTPQQLIKKYSK
jgi:hypothetical protein